MPYPHRANIIDEINRIIAITEDGEPFAWRRIDYPGALESVFSTHPKFGKALFNGPDLQFLPLQITTTIGILYFGITKSIFAEYLQFVFDHQPLYKRLHDSLRKLRYKPSPEDVATNKETVKQILLGVTTDQSRPPMNQNQLLRDIYQRIYALPYLPDTQEMYSFYLRNLLGSVVQTNIRPTQRVSLENGAEETVKRLPWKSRVKANDYMNRRGWNDQQREHARQRLQNDHFNVKASKNKYQLHMVAPRNTYIIDLFFPGKFVYLLAINVNTRKAFAIPSPLITKQGNHRFHVPKEGHKSTHNVLRMFKKLVEQATVKMIIHDKEKAFLSREFTQYCLNNGITIKPYTQYSVQGLTETNDTTRTLHGMLSILDRLCRTLRNMAFNMGVENQDIEPDIMQYLLNAYNSSPHTLFYNVLHLRLSPNDMDADKSLEDALCYHLSKMNFVIMNSNNYNINCPVRVMNDASLFDKLKHKLLPGIFQVIGKDGNLFICKQGDNIIKVPRWMIREAVF